MQTKDVNPELELAWQCVESTGSHLFLTGKAGTGKTTFLRKLKEQSPKRMIVVAPTGIAAINAGGVTIHSFFQLSFAPYIPETKFTSKQSHYKFGKEKISIIRGLDLLVIDEISMVRADLLDAVDDVLRRYRDRNKPFGGVQLLMIGDMQQLAPVVKDDERELLSGHYDTLYFFGSQALRGTEYITIQLERVYRQSDNHFLSLLNRIRVNNVDSILLDELNERYIPGFQPREDDGYIRLTTHNYQAQRINDRQLSLLPGKSVKFSAQITGTFPETAYPADVNLILKTGAQIMFIKNDSSGEKRFYNGKIGVVIALTNEGIRVRGKDDDLDFQLEKEEWANSKYTLNSESKEITEEIEGVFRQYPIRLAWAITIHKSQGLTFERAIIDAKSSFTHGQVYVALSRCKTLEGMVLNSPLSKDSVICDETINGFTSEIEKHIPDNNKLNDLKKQYFYDLLCEQFGFKNINNYFSQLLRLFDEYLYKLYPKQLRRYKENYERFNNEIVKISGQFQMVYSERVLNAPDYSTDEKLMERIISGATYFRDKTEDIIYNLLAVTQVETDNKDVRKKFTDAYTVLEELTRIKMGTLAHTAKHGFSATSYLKHKAYIILSFSPNEKTRTEKKPGKKRSEPKVEISPDILHPELYARIIKWRNREAYKDGLPVYTVIQQKAIIGIVNLLPSTPEELVRIPYFGRKTAEKYGAELLDMVHSYMVKKKIDRKQIF